MGPELRHYYTHRCLSTKRCKAATLQWRHNERDSVSNHQPHQCLLIVYSSADHRKHQSSASLAFVRGPVNSPHKFASNAENVSIWWRHHETVVGRQQAQRPVFVYIWMDINVFDAFAIITIWFKMSSKIWLNIETWPQFIRNMPSNRTICHQSFWKKGVFIEKQNLIDICPEH